MDATLGICLVVVLMKPSICLEGGRKTRIGEFPFLVEIQKNDQTRCLGIIVDQLQVVFPDGCLEKPQFSLGYSPVYVVPVVKERPPKKYKGWFVVVASYDVYSTSFTGYFDVVRLEHPGIVLAQKYGNISLPTSATLNRRTSLRDSHVIIVGLNRRVGTMRIVGENGFHRRISMNPLRASLMRTKYIQQDRLFCAVMGNSTRSIENVPRGKACSQDVGAPVIQNGTVVGMVIHASCSVKVKWPATYFVRLTYSDIPKEKVSEFP